jgi:PAS domain S-box-containing protein
MHADPNGAFSSRGFVRCAGSGDAALRSLARKRDLGMVSVNWSAVECDGDDAFLRGLSEALDRAEDALAVRTCSAEALGKYLEVDRVIIAGIAIDSSEISVADGFLAPGAEPTSQSFQVHDFGGFFADLRQLPLVRIEEIPARAADGQAWKYFGSRAALGGRFAKRDGRIEAFCALSTEPRAWEKAEAAFMAEVGERTREALERLRIQDERRDVADTYRSLLSSIDSGFAIVELVRDGESRVVDLVYRDVNPAFESLTGLKQILGKSVLELMPNFDPQRIMQIQRAADTGEASCHEHYVKDLDRWFRVHHARLGGPGSPFVAAVFDDIMQRKKRDAAPQETDARFRAMTDQAELGVAMFGLDQRITYTNAAYARMFALTSEDLLGQNMENLTVPEDWQRKKVMLERLFSEGKSFTIEKRHARPDGRAFWVRSNVSAQRDASGRIVGGVTASIDVTDLKQAELEKRDVEGRYRLLFDSIDHGFCTIEVLFDAADRPYDYRFLEVNAAFERQTGLQVAIGRTIRELAPSHEEHWFEIYGRIARTGIPARFEAPAETLGAYYEVYAFRVGRPEARQVGVLFNDVGERKRASDALMLSEARFRQFGEASSDLLWIRDAESLALEYLSPAFERIYGMDRETALADEGMKSWLDTITTEDREEVVAGIERVRQGERSDTTFRVIRPSDGQERWLGSTAFPLLDARGRVQRVGAIDHDLTEERQTANRLRILVSELQHRTRNLLAVIRAVSRRTLQSSASLEDFAERFGSRLEALERVNSLLSGLQDSDRIRFDRLIETELKAHGIVGEQDLHGPTVVLNGPKGIRLRSGTVQTFALAIHELTTNAVKYGALSRPEGRLEINWSVAMNAGEPRLRVIWEESGVRVDALAVRPAGSGYGRELIERALPYQLQAEIRYDLRPEGLRCEIVLPISSKV